MSTTTQCLTFASAAELGAAITSVIHCADVAGESNRFQLANVHVVYDGNSKCRLEATDGRRLAVAYCQCDGNPFGAILNVTDMRKLAKSLGKSRTSVYIDTSGDKLMVLTKNSKGREIEQEIRKIEGRFPPVLDYVERTHASNRPVIRGTPKEFADWLNPEKICFSVEGGKYQRTDRRPDLEFIAGEDIALEFNPEFVLAWAKTLPENAIITLHYKDPASEVLATATLQGGTTVGSEMVFMPCA